MSLCKMRVIFDILKRKKTDKKVSKLYKLTDQNNMTAYHTKWGEGVTHSVFWHKRKPVLCGSGVLHAYRNKDLGLVLNPVQASIKNPRLWEAEGSIAVDSYDKCGCYKLTTIRELPLPAWYADEHARRDTLVKFAILCSDEVLCVFETEHPNDKKMKEILTKTKSCYNLKTRDNSLAYIFYNVAYGAYDTVYNTYDAVCVCNNISNISSHVAVAATCAIHSFEMINKEVDLGELFSKALEIDKFEIPLDGIDAWKQRTYA